MGKERIPSNEMINFPTHSEWPLRAWHLSSRPRDPRYVDPRWDHPNKNNRFFDSMDTKTNIPKEN